MRPTNEPEMFTTRGQVFLRWSQAVLILTGALALSYVALTLLSAWRYQEEAESTLEKQISASDLHKTESPSLTIREGDVLGRLEVARLNISVEVLEGTTARTLRLGAGHIDGTAFPGQSGNVGIAGHRDTYFRALRMIRPTDEIQIQTASGLTRYAVDWVQITTPDDVAIVAPSTKSSLTLITCYPFYYIGAAPERYVVHAHQN